MPARFRILCRVWVGFATAAALGGCGEGIDTLPGEPDLEVRDGLKAWYRADRFDPRFPGAKTPMQVLWDLESWAGYGPALTYVPGTNPIFYHPAGISPTSETQITFSSGSSYFGGSGVLTNSATAFDIFVVGAASSGTGEFFHLASPTFTSCAGSQNMVEFRRSAINETTFQFCQGASGSYPVAIIDAAMGARIHQATFHGANLSVSFWISGTGSNSVGVPAGSIDLSGVTKFGKGTADPAYSQLSEVLVYDRVLSSEETENVRTYLRRRNSIWNQP